MASLPRTDATIILRSSFSADAAWSELTAMFEQNGPLASSYVLIVDDPVWGGVSVEEARAAVSPGYGPLMFIADERAFSTEGMQLLAVEPTRDVPVFRCPVCEFENVNDNLSLGNLDWDDFLPHLDADGVFRGFVV